MTHEKPVIADEALKSVADLLGVAGVLIDMFYDPEDYPELDADFEAILPAMALLQKNGIESPEVAIHVALRYLQERGSHG